MATEIEEIRQYINMQVSREEITRLADIEVTTEEVMSIKPMYQWGRDT